MLNFYFNPINYTVDSCFLGLHIHKCNHVQALNKTCMQWGQIKLYQNVSLLMCYYSFVECTNLNLETQSVRRTIELLFKIKISQGYSTSNTNLSDGVYVQAPFCELYGVFNGTFLLRIASFFFHSNL